MTLTHGAVLEKNNLATMILAPTLSGKSTLTALLCMNGYKYLSDDIIPIKNNDFTVAPFPKILCIRDDKILKGYNEKSDNFFLRPGFAIKTYGLNNIIDKREILYPISTIDIYNSQSYKISDIYFLKKNDINLNSVTSIKSVSKVDGCYNLLKNLKSPYDLRKDKDFIYKIVKKTKFKEITYNHGYDYLKYFN